jgi:hypothetical protein
VTDCNGSQGKAKDLGSQGQGKAKDLGWQGKERPRTWGHKAKERPRTCSTVLKDPRGQGHGLKDSKPGVLRTSDIITFSMATVTHIVFPVVDRF